MIPEPGSYIRELDYPPPDDTDRPDDPELEMLAASLMGLPETVFRQVPDSLVSLFWFDEALLLWKQEQYLERFMEVSDVA